LKTFFGTTFGKIVIGIVAAAVVAGGGYGIYRAVQAEPDAVDTVVADTTTEAEIITTEEKMTEAPTEPPTMPTTTTTMQTTTTKAPAAANQDVIEIMNTDTSMGWIAGPYKFAYDGEKWAYGSTHAMGAFKVPAGYVLKTADGEVLARGEETAERLYARCALWKQ